MTITRKELLEVALSGYQQQVGVMQDRMREITRELLMGTTPKRQPPTKRRRRMSPEGRARIAAATRKRWAAYRKGREASGV